MTGKPAIQLSLPDSAFSSRTKRARTDNLLQMVDELMDGSKLVAMVEKSYKPRPRGRPGIQAL